ncbi:MAG: hypothetical protein WBQ85_16865 [Candidatus Sulfotelmatobacter sp.]
MNRKLYAISLAAVFLAISFLTSCSSSSSSTHTTPPPTTTPFAFYLSGQEEINEGPNYYALAGAVTIDSSGNVTGGEQDYNDAFGVTSPEPSGDSITGGTLTIDGTGQGTLTLITNNTAVGSSSTPGTETLAVQFVNADHALITQFDGSATSSGSMDLQTLSGTPSGGFAFTMSGVDPSYAPIAFGGVFTLPSAATDEVDANDNGTLVTAAPLTGSLGAPDSFGRGSVTSSLEYGTTPIVFNYYIVGPEAIRIIDVDADDSAVGSAYGQGTNATAGADTSLVASVFGVSGNPWGFEYATAGQFTTNSTNGSFAGVGEEAELETFLSGAASAVGGPYSIAANGYGSLTIGGFGGGDVSAMQVYATDPTLDLMDPNNASGNPDVGGALLLDFDAVLAGGTGVVVPQTDTTATDFNGNYAAGWQDLNNLVPASACYGCEFDMIANGTMTSGGALSLSEGEVSDPFETLDAGGAYGTGTFTGMPTPDNTNAGRLTLLSTDPAPGGSLTASIGTSPFTSFDAIIYQASASQLFWLEYDFDSVFLGPIEVQGSLTGLPTVARPVKAQAKQKHW